MFYIIKECTGLLPFYRNPLGLVVEFETIKNFKIFIISIILRLAFILKEIRVSKRIILKISQVKRKQKGKICGKIVGYF